MRRWSSVLQLWLPQNRRKKDGRLPKGRDIPDVPAVVPAAPRQVADKPAAVVPPTVIEIPGRQRALLLHGTKQPYQATEDHAIPELRGEREILVKTHVIGLNPIDWKSP